MDEYIRKESAISIFRAKAEMAVCTPAQPYFDCAAKMLELLPAADVAPVRHGRWECIYDDSTGETDITCSYCKNTRTIKGCFVSTDGKSCYFEDDYCPNCGAKMEETDERK